MWKFWKKGKEERVNKIQVKGKDIFEFDLDNEWNMTQVGFEYNGQGRVSQMVIFLENEGE